jgi:hypothetical protein
MCILDSGVLNDETGFWVVLRAFQRLFLPPQSVLENEGFLGGARPAIPCGGGA